ncbi:MAG: flagellar export protein FliJ [Nitrospinota bacterium]
MPFRFRLEAVLKHRLWVEEERRRELAALAGMLRGERRALEGMKGELDANRGKLRSLLESPEGVPSEEAHLYAQYFLGQSWAIEEKKDLCRRLAVEVERKRQQLLHASIARRSLEMMKERLRQRYEKEVLRKEQKISDELGLRQHGEKEKEAWVQ